jgi:hypothetical protein
MEGNKEEYIRVGTCLYKIAQQPLVNGTCTLRRIPWMLWHYPTGLWQEQYATYSEI